MNDENESIQSFVPLEERLPEREQRVIVVCRESRSYGYVDENGIWRSHYTNKELQNVIGWAP